MSSGRLNQLSVESVNPSAQSISLQVRAGRPAVPERQFGTDWYHGVHPDERQGRTAGIPGVLGYAPCQTTTGDYRALQVIGEEMLPELPVDTRYLTRN